MKALFQNYLFKFVTLFTLIIGRQIFALEKPNYHYVQKAQKIIHTYLLESEKENQVVVMEMPLLSNAIAAENDKCFFAGWESILKNGKCENPVTGNKSVKACSGKDQFRCNPTIFGGGPDGDCISGGKNLNSITKNCVEHAKKYDSDILNDYLKNPTKLANLISSIKNSCQSKNTTSCKNLSARLKDLDSKFKSATELSLDDFKKHYNMNQSLGVMDSCQEKYQKDNEGFFASMVASDRNIIEGVEDNFYKCNRLELERNQNFEDFADDLETISDKIVPKEILAQVNNYDLDTSLKALLSSHLQYGGKLDDNFINKLKKDYPAIKNSEELNKILDKNIQEFKNAEKYIKDNIAKKNEDIVKDFKDLGSKLNSLCSDIKNRYKDVKSKGTFRNSDEENTFYRSEQEKIYAVINNFKAQNNNAKLLATSNLRDDFFPITNDLAEKCAEDDIDTIANQSLQKSDIEKSSREFNKMMYEGLKHIDDNAKLVQKNDPNKLKDAIKDTLKYRPYLIGNLLENKKDNLDELLVLSKYICKNSLDIYNNDEIWNIAEIGLAAGTLVAAGAAFFIPGVGPLVSAGLIAKVAAVGVIGAEATMAYRRFDDGNKITLNSQTGLGKGIVSTKRASEEIDRGETNRNWAVFDGAMTVVGSGVIGKVVHTANKVKIIKPRLAKTNFDPKVALETFDSVKVTKLEHIKPDVNYANINFSNFHANPNYKHFVSSYTNILFGENNGRKLFLKEINGPQMLQEYNNFKTLQKLGIDTEFIGVTKGPNGKLFMVSEFAEGAIAKHIDGKGFVTSGIDSTYNIGQHTYKQIEEIKNILLKNGIEANDIQFIIKKDGSVSLIDVDAYKFKGQDLTNLYDPKSVEFQKRLDELQRTYQGDLSKEGALSLLTHKADGISDAIKRDFDKAKKIKEDYVDVKTPVIEEDITTVIIKSDDLTTVRKPTPPPSEDDITTVIRETASVDDVTTIRAEVPTFKRPKVKWAGPQDLENLNFLKRHLEANNRAIKEALDANVSIPLYTVRQNNKIMEQMALVLRKNDIETKLVKSNFKGSVEPILNLEIVSVGNKASPTAQTYWRALQKLKGNKLTLSSIDNLEINASGFFSNQEKRVELGYGAFSDLVENSRNTTPLHELRHLMGLNDIDSGNKNLFSFRFSKSEDLNLYGKSGKEKDYFYSDYMQTDELYTHGSDMLVLARTKNSLSPMQKFETLVKLNRISYGISQLTYNTFNLVQDFTEPLKNAAKKFYPQTVTGDGLQIADVNKRTLTIPFSAKDKEVFHLQDFNTALKEIDDPKVREYFLAKKKEITDNFLEAYPKSGKRAPAGVQVDLLDDLMSRWKKSYYYKVNELSPMESDAIKGYIDWFKAYNNTHTNLVQEMQEWYYKNKFIKNAQENFNSLSEYAIAANDKNNKFLKDFKEAYDLGLTSEQQLDTFLDRALELGRMTRFAK